MSTTGCPSAFTPSACSETATKSLYHVDKVRTRLGDPTPVNMNLQSQGQQAAAGGAAPAPEADRGMSKEQKEKLEKAAKENEEIIKKNKALNDSFNAGKEAMLAKDYAAAVAAFQKGTELDPSQHVVWANLADAYTGLATTKAGAEQEAALQKTLEAYQKAIELQPADAGYHNNLALALARDKKFDEAQAELNKAAQLDPPNAGKYYYNLGALLVNSGQTAASEQAFQKAIEADPNYADAQFQYATALSAKLTIGADGKMVAPPGMREALEKYLALAPTGQFAEGAKALLQQLGATVQTEYTNPNAPKKGGKKK